MGYKIELFSDLEIVLVTVNCTLDQEMRKELHLNVVRNLTINGYQRILIDVCNSCLSQDYSTTDSINMVTYMQKFVPEKETKIAFLSAYEETLRKDFVNTAQLAGINIKYFIDQDDAIEWLCQEERTFF